MGEGWAGRTLPHSYQKRSRLNKGLGREVLSGQDAGLCYLLPTSSESGDHLDTSGWHGRYLRLATYQDESSSGSWQAASATASSGAAALGPPA